MKLALLLLASLGAASPVAELAAALDARARGELGVAIERLTALTRAHPEMADAHAQLGMSLAWAGELSRAVEVMERAVALGANRGARLGRARVLAWAGRPAASADEARALIDEDPDDLEAWRILGLARLVDLDAPGAREAYARALLLAPDDEEARLGLERARDLRRTELRLSLGGAHLRDLGVVPGGDLALRWRATRALSLRGAYALGGAPWLGQDPFTQRLTAGALLSLGAHTLDLGAGGRLSAAEGAAWVHLGGALGLPVGAVFGSLRPGLGTRGPELQGDLGARANLVGPLFTSARVFAGLDVDGAALVGVLAAGLDDLLGGLRLSAGAGATPGGPLLNVGATARLRVSPGSSVGASYAGLFSSALERHELTLFWELGR